MCLMVVVWVVLHVLLSFSGFVNILALRLETSYNIESQVAPNPKDRSLHWQLFEFHTLSRRIAPKSHCRFANRGVRQEVAVSVRMPTADSRH